jgi:hypothetical protein
MFSDNFKNIGIGNIERYWTQVFTSLWKEPNNSNPLYDGTHWKGMPLFSQNELHFIVNYYHDIEPTNITIFLNNKTIRNMTLYTGIKNKGTYVYVLKNYTSLSCAKYVFQTVVNNVLYQLPETGYFLTNGINKCTKNYSKK